MSPDPVTAERAYARLKGDIMDGRYPPRALLVTQSIADDYGTSISPIRDSMQRLIGERMLEAQAGGGFRMPEVTTDGLRDLYAWHEQLVRLALGPSSRAVALAPLRLADTDPPSAVADAAAELFAAIAERADNRELGEAILAASARLHLIRRYESRLIRNVVTELRSLWSHATNGPAPALRCPIKAYHRRRLRRVGQLSAALHNPEFFQDRRDSGAGVHRSDI